jgi:hypothetical protein
MRDSGAGAGSENLRTSVSALASRNSDRSAMPSALQLAWHQRQGGGAAHVHQSDGYEAPRVCAQDTTASEFKKRCRRHRNNPRLPAWSATDLPSPTCRVIKQLFALLEGLRGAHALTHCPRPAPLPAFLWRARVAREFSPPSMRAISRTARHGRGSTALTVTPASSCLATTRLVGARGQLDLCQRLMALTTY